MRRVVEQGNNLRARIHASGGNRRDILHKTGKEEVVFGIRGQKAQGPNWDPLSASLRMVSRKASSIHVPGELLTRTQGIPL